MIETYEIHDAAALVALASEDEQVALNEDVKENGLKNPIVLFQGKIIDGRCRQTACVYANERIRFTEIDDDTPIADVEVLVKSLNTRRNLTTTQKVICACKESLKPGSKTIATLAKSWGVGYNLVKNARKIHELRPELIQPLFNGKAVSIVDKHGKELDTTRISAIYAWAVRYEEGMVGAGGDDKQDFGWKEDTQFVSHHAKEFYYEQVSALEINDLLTRMAFVNYANVLHPAIDGKPVDTTSFEVPIAHKEITIDDMFVMPEHCDAERFITVLQTTYFKELFKKKVDEGKDSKGLRNILLKQDTLDATKGNK